MWEKRKKKNLSKVVYLSFLQMNTEVYRGALGTYAKELNTKTNQNNICSREPIDFVIVMRIDNGMDMHRLVAYLDGTY